LNYGVIFGRQVASDSDSPHKNWTLDVDKAAAAITEFFSLENLVSL
jgi:hypothetical protein